MRPSIVAVMLVLVCGCGAPPQKPPVAESRLLPKPLEQAEDEAQKVLREDRALIASVKPGMTRKQYLALFDERGIYRRCDWISLPVEFADPDSDRDDAPITQVGELRIEMLLPHEPASAHEASAILTRDRATIESIKPGMTRAQLYRVFTDGEGLFTRTHERFYYRNCRWIYCDVEFKPIGNQAEELIEAPQDEIVSISAPQLYIPESVEKR